MLFFVRYSRKGKCKTVGEEQEDLALFVKSHEDIDTDLLSETMLLIDGKWKLPILCWLWKEKVMRYNALKRAIGGISHKMLASQLDELERDQLIVRTEYSQRPPKVEYSLSEHGQALILVLHELCCWGQRHLEE